ncbi:hypothetical protein M0811_06201 [Anaeramoeba ignava]|uniref:Ankyrin repeat protein n=1 Tax=Anaeramoeba ignava TaxID=1746090 RepID=A0A9Q0LPZ8_ANAIG|nr:hypothetical protein M0811_06201 [Anaeramoeba ignava]
MLSLTIQSPLHFLCQNTSITIDMIRILINKGVNFNFQEVKKKRKKEIFNEFVNYLFWNVELLIRFFGLSDAYILLS